ncbi:MAG: hypothetical protein Q9218_007140 [Villophora microphyllina]
MHLLLPWLGLLCFVLELVHASPIEPKDQLLPNLPIGANPSTLNAGLGYGPIPKGFKIKVGSRQQPPRRLPEDALLINTIHFLKVLGQADIGGEIGPQDFTTAQYPSLVLRVGVPASERTIRREYVIWALALAIHIQYAEAELPAFWMTQYSLNFNDRLIGTLSLGVPGQLDSEAASANNTTTMSQNGTENVHLVTARDDNHQPTHLLPREEGDIQTTANADRLTVVYQYYGHLLNKFDLMLDLIWIMAQASIPPANAVPPSIWVPGWMEGHVKFTANTLERTVAPKMSWFWMLEGLERGADFLVGQNRYASIDILLEVDGVDVGRLSFRHV